MPPAHKLQQKQYIVDVSGDKDGEALNVCVMSLCPVNADGQMQLQTK